MAWDIEVTDEFKAWYENLEEDEAVAVGEAVVALEARGPSLGRPFVDTLTASRLRNLKELRPKRNNIRILFVFDPRRSAILLLGGSRTNDWHDWYTRNIPEAERLYDAYLAELRREGLL